MEEILYCTVCRSRLREKIVQARKYKHWQVDSDFTHQYLVPYPKYDVETGKILYIKEIRCPKFRFIQWSSHDAFSIGEPFTK